MWLPYPKEIKIKTNEVHLWRAFLDREKYDIETLAQILSPDEKNRAHKFHFMLHRNRFIVARSMLRKILGNYLEMEPHKLHFNYSPKGKPSLSLEQCNYPLEFNLSHSENIALYAITLDSQVGIDLEHIRPIDNLAKIAQRFFAPQEYEIINKFSQSEQAKIFYQIWTGKEAYLKATGEGLANSIDQVIIDISSEYKTSFVSIKGEPNLANQWNLYNFIPAPNYLASLVLESKPLVVSYYDC